VCSSTIAAVLSELNRCCQFSDSSKYVWVNPLLSEAMEKKKAEVRAKLRLNKKDTK